MNIEYTKVLAGDYNVRYIDKDNKWFKKEFVGHFKPSRKMPITKVYGVCTLNIENSEVYGLRVI